MFRGNGWGIGLALAGSLIGGLFSYVFKLSDPQALMIVGGTWGILDVLLRLSRRQGPRGLLDRQSGGVVWSIPVWMLGLVMLLISAGAALTV